MSTPRIYDFSFDDENESKFAEHGLTAERVSQVLDGPHVVVPNRKGRRAPRLVIGRDRGGACIAIPVESTRERGVWRPVTAWPCKAQEEARLP